ncbi:transcription/translation regulatory transformer protein RfaH [Ectothiorhodospira shaposhnikovii]|uniref:transcription/translation regulatory transformer protein RfaH n=1 Tax=Ectothiorhodospira shaposhnikovii TaxID=1054 RepID=UPI0039A1EA97
METAWYLVYCKPRQEALAASRLRAQDYRIYLPRLKRRVRRAGRIRELEEALFPRYLFAAPSHEDQSIAPIRSTVGVTSLVRFGEQYPYIDAGIISLLRGREDPATGCHHLPADLPQPGQRVVITQGPLEGLEGIFETLSGETRVFILLDWLGKQTRARINLEDIRRIA